MVCSGRVSCKTCCACESCFEKENTFVLNIFLMVKFCCRSPVECALLMLSVGSLAQLKPRFAVPCCTKGIPTLHFGLGLGKKCRAGRGACSRTQQACIRQMDRAGLRQR